jgi:NAD(P)-dependent dehydrogenase (short-subunit alcohol dehydrogenase family)
LGAHVAVLGRDEARARPVLDDLKGAGATAAFFEADVADWPQVQAAASAVLDRWGRVDILINGAGGNRPPATTTPDLQFFDLPEAAVRQVLDMNFVGAFLCCQAFGRPMAAQKSGAILNIGSVTTLRPLTRTPVYSAAKAALGSLTQWLAVHMAQTYSPHIRVNAVAPGFFLTEQNRYLLTDQTTSGLTPRGQAILAHTPANRFGEPQDITGALLFLVSGAAAFVTGVVLPVDGGFTAFGGV